MFKTEYRIQRRAHKDEVWYYAQYKKWWMFFWINLSTISWRDHSDAIEDIENHKKRY